VDEGAHVVAFVLDADHRSELFFSGTVDRVTTVNGRLEEYQDLERAVVVHEVDSVVHLGAQSLVGAALRAPLLTMEANVRGTYNLLEVCRCHMDLVRRIVIASSDKSYGDLQPPPYSEDMPPAGRHPYDLSKAMPAPTTFRSRSPAAGTSTEAATCTGVASFPERSAACSTESDPCCEAMVRRLGTTSMSTMQSMLTFSCATAPSNPRPGVFPSTSVPDSRTRSARSWADFGDWSGVRISSP
jgi:hypothetical protein